MTKGLDELIERLVAETAYSGETGVCPVLMSFYLFSQTPCEAY